jgi:voltage-gated potassium channel
MLRAGANSTVSPSRIGGLRMASEIIRPHVVGFLDLMLREQSQTLRVEEIDVAESSPWAGLPLSRLAFSSKFNLLVLALKHDAATAQAKLWVNPPDTVGIKAGDAIIVMGDVKDIIRARHAAGPVSAPATPS